MQELPTQKKNKNTININQHKYYERNQNFTHSDINGIYVS